MRKDLENEDIMTYIHYLGLDDNIELFEDLKDEIRFVIGYSKRNNLDFCLVDDFENGYFKNFELVKQFDKLCCIKEIESFVDKPIETKIGTFYITRDSREDFYCSLCDSNKEWVANIYNRELIEDLKNIEDISELVDIGIVDDVSYNESLDDLFDYYLELCDEGTYYAYPPEDKYEIYQNFKGYVNKVGNMYFLVNYQEM